MADHPEAGSTSPPAMSVVVITPDRYASISTVLRHRARGRRNRPLSAPLGGPFDQYRAKPLQRAVVRPICELEQERQNGNSGKAVNGSFHVQRK
jgi:hypothetical protein